MAHLIPKEVIHELWKGTEKYLKVKVSRKMTFEFEVHPPVILGIIKTGEKELAQKAKTILEDLGFIIQKNGDKHGKGSRCLVQISLNLLKNEDVVRINKMINVIDETVLPETISTPEKVTVEEKATKEIVTNKKLLAACKQSFSRIISRAFAFENERVHFSYLKNEKDALMNFQTIEAETLESAKKICIILRWILGESKATQDGRTIITDCFGFLNKPAGFTFCFPPKDLDVSEEEITRRLKKIFPGSKPKVEKSNNFFSVQYSKDSVNQKLAKELLTMGWPVKLNHENGWIEINLKTTTEEPTEQSTEKKDLILSATAIPGIKEQPKEKLEPVDQFEQAMKQNREEKAKLREQLSNAIADPNFFHRLSANAQQKALENLKTDDPDKYINTLLDLIKNLG